MPYEHRKRGAHDSIVAPPDCVACFHGLAIYAQKFADSPVDIFFLRCSCAFVTLITVGIFAFSLYFLKADTAFTFQHVTQFLASGFFRSRGDDSLHIFIRRDPRDIFVRTSLFLNCCQYLGSLGFPALLPACLNEWHECFAQSDGYSVAEEFLTRGEVDLFEGASEPIFVTL